MSAKSGSIYYDKYEKGAAAIMHKKHNVSSASRSAYLPLYTRNSLSDSLSYSYSKRNYTSPTGLCADPQVSGSLSGELLKVMGGGAGVLDSLSCSLKPNKACATSPESSDTQIAAEICRQKSKCKKPGTATQDDSHQVKCPEQVRVRDDGISFSTELFGVTKYKKQKCGGSWWTCDNLADKCPLAHNHLKPGEGSWGRSWYVDNETGARVSAGACGHYYASKYDADHRSVSYPCSTHTYYACQTPSTSAHSLQASCSSTDSNGNYCTVTSFYACDSHTHVYPTPSPAPTPSPTPTPSPPPAPTTVACGGASYTGCLGASSRKAHHVPSCGNCGAGYWTCSQYASRHTDSKTCKRSGCGATLTPCQNGPNKWVRPGKPANWHWL